MKIYLAGITGVRERERKGLFKWGFSILLSYYLTIDNLFDHKKATIWCIRNVKQII